MHRLFAVASFLAATVVACGSTTHPQSDAASAGGRMSDSAVAGGSSAGGASPATGGAGGSSSATGKGGSSAGGSEVAGGTSAGGGTGASASGGASATGGTSGSVGEGGSAGAAGMAGAGGTAGTSSAAGAGGSAGKISAGGSTAGTAGTAIGKGGAGGGAGTSASGGTSGTAGKTGTGGTTANGGTSGTSTSTDNVADVVVDVGLPNIGYVNGLFASVTVCVPGTSNCQTIDHVLVDTGSSGLRVLGSVLTLSLPTWTNDSGIPLAECTQFVSSFTWGPVHSADLKIAGEQAKGIPIQVIEASSFPVPSTCTGTNSNSPETLGCNGIIGVSALVQDCGPACAATPGTRSANPGVYYACSSNKKGGCQVTAVPVAKQVSNPVPLFENDNNGTIIQLPAISADGASLVKGSLVFGIGTRANNDLGKATVLQLDNTGTLATAYPAKSTTHSLAFVDSGSNALYFPNTGTTRIPVCPGAYSGFYCPRTTLTLSATIIDASGLVTVTAGFSIANTTTLFANLNNVAFSNLGGTSSTPMSGSSGMGAYFDWGLPFYFGKSVFTAIEGQSTPSGTGPYVAF